ncbi:MAG TPA: TIGR02147 family protein [Polyangiales bacterium]|nr:TIGR02147 family protein [Polyangiales bacterium]
MSRRAAVDVFAFRDYRQFLRAYYDAGKAGGQAVTLRAFSKRAGLRSPNYLKLVMDGTRNLTQPMAARFADAAGLRAEAAEYFCELVAFNQAKTAADRGRAYERLRRFPRYRKVYKLDAAQESYHSSWYLPALRELIAHKDFKDDPRWIAKQLMPAISPREAERALATLLELGLVERDANDRLVQRDPLVTTPDGPLGHHVVSYHRSMLERAAAALDAVPRDEREIAALTLCLSGAQIDELKQRLERFREELLQLYTAGPDASRIVQVNLQMFPLSVKEN